MGGDSAASEERQSVWGGCFLHFRHGHFECQFIHIKHLSLFIFFFTSWSSMFTALTCFYQTVIGRGVGQHFPASISTVLDSTVCTFYCEAEDQAQYKWSSKSLVCSKKKKSTSSCLLVIPLLGIMEMFLTFCQVNKQEPPTETNQKQILTITSHSGPFETNSTLKWKQM